MTSWTTADKRYVAALVVAVAAAGYLLASNFGLLPGLPGAQGAEPSPVPSPDIVQEIPAPAVAPVLVLGEQLAAPVVPAAQVVPVAPPAPTAPPVAPPPPVVPPTDPGQTVNTLKDTAEQTVGGLIGTLLGLL